MSRMERRRWIITSSGNLAAAAVADGATIVYRFDEASGDLLNRAQGGVFDLTVDAQITRGVIAPGGPDNKAYGFIQTSQGSFPFGHAQGNRPDQNGWTRVTHECVCRVNTAAQNGRAIIDGLWLGVVPLFGLSNDNNNDVTAFISLTGGYTQPFNLSRNYKSGWHHYVWLYTGTNFQGYVDGAQDFDIVTGIGGPSFSDAAVGGDRRIAVGGVCQSTVNNCHVDVAFYALYPNLALSAGQIAAHRAASGV